MNTIICPICKKKFKSLGYARHRAMHYEEKISHISWCNGEKEADALVKASEGVVK